MNHAHAPGRGRSISPLCFATACAALASACSGEYPLGERSQISLPIETREASQASVGDARVPAGLEPAEVIIAAGAGEPYPGSLASAGDLDGDGRAEMALADLDPILQVAFVQLRYGGPRPGDAEQTFAFAHGGAFLTLADNGTPTVTAAGDIDADGYGDLLIRTLDCDTTKPSEGTYLVYGGPERLEGSLPLTSVAAHFVPIERQANPPPGFGLSCSGGAPLVPAGDLDGDGFDDLVIDREPINDTTNGQAIFGTGEGVYVFYGRSARFSGRVPLESADATFHIEELVYTYPQGDLDGDGLADLIVSPDAYRAPAPGSFLIRGRGQRWSGSQPLSGSATLLANAYVTTGGWQNISGDLDGDGRNEVLLFDSDFGRHLFYGAPGLFADGVDFTQANASIGDTAGYVYAVGDRDGDGDDELIDQFMNGEAMDLATSLFSSNVAFASGSRERLSGVIPFPEGEVMAQAPDGPFPDQRSYFGDAGLALRYAIPAGDLDGDGAEDLFTTSVWVTVPDTSGGYDASGSQIHIHYGVPASTVGIVR